MAERTDHVSQDQSFSSRKSDQHFVSHNKETRGTFVPIHEAFFRQNLQYLEGWTSTFEVTTFVGVKDMPIRKHAVGHVANRELRVLLALEIGEDFQLPLSRLDSLAFSLAAVFVRHHQLRPGTGYLEFHLFADDTNLFPNLAFAISTLPIIHSVCPPKFCISIVFNFS